MRLSKAVLQQIKLLSFVLPLVLFFQNCSPALNSGGKQTQTLLTDPKSQGSVTEGNGGVYDGKPFVNVMSGGLCADGSPYRSEIYLGKKSARVTRENCAQIPAKAVSLGSLQYLKHNEANVIHDQRVYDRMVVDLKPTSYLCRSHYKMVFKEGEHRIIGDFILSQEPENKKSYSGQIKIGFYNHAMRLVSTPFDSGNLALRSGLTKKDDHAYTTFDADFENDGRKYQLSASLRLDNLEGFVWLKSLEDGVSKPPSLKDPPNFGFRVLCYEH